MLAKIKSKRAEWPAAQEQGRSQGWMSQRLERGIGRLEVAAKSGFLDRPRRYAATDELGMTSIWGMGIRDVGDFWVGAG